MNDIKTEDTPLYNSRITKNYIEYLRKNYPEINIGEILDYAGITFYQLEDGAHWFTQAQVDRFQEILGKKTNGENIPREVGQQFTKSKTSGVISQYVLGFVTPASAYAMLEKLQTLLSRASTIQTRSLGSGKLEVIIKPNPGVFEKPYQCENRIGTYESIAKLFTSKLANVEHPTCLHHGGDVCRYIITWENTPTFIWKRIRNYSTLASVLLCSGLSFFLPGLFSLITVLSCMIFILALSSYSKYVQVRELETNLHNQGEVARSLITESNIRYNNALLIQEIGQAVSVILNIDDLLAYVMEALKKRLEFERGMILLSNPKKTRLNYRAGYGYNPEHEQYITGVEFHLDNPDSRGPIVEAYMRQISILVDNVADIKENLSTRSRDFATLMGTHSFISIPIVFEGDSLGVLTVDNVQSKKRLSQTDISLLMGIAPQIAISINNANSYRIILESEEKFRSLSENAPDIIYTIDIDGAFTYVNPAWERILGYKTDDVIGKPVTAFVREEDVKKYIHVFQQVRENKETIRDYIGTIIHKDGSERFFSMSGTPNLNLEGNVIGLIGVMKDITDRRQLEAQLLQAQKMEAVGTLAGGIAHDFNNLLMGFQGFASLMMLDINESHIHYEKLKRIEDLVKSGADLTRQLLGFARGGKYEVKITDLNEIIEKTSNMFSRTQKDISIHKKFKKGLWTVEGDRGQIEQVLLNLYVNAWQAMPGGGQLYLETANVILDEQSTKSILAKPGRYVKVSVTDTGIGMDERTRKRVFEPFFTTKEMGRGTGLGLASAYGIVTSHNGIINVYSEPGHGTTFNMYLPATEKIIIHEKQMTGDILKGEGLILLVDDEDVIIDVSREILEELGYKVMVARSGLEAIDIFKKKWREIDLVILDIIMPGLTAKETIDSLKTINPEIRVLLSSGYSINDQVISLMEQGCHGFIQKPYGVSDMSIKVCEVLHK